MDIPTSLFTQLLPVIGAGLVAGFINVNAGGGSYLTLPSLILMGIPPTVANATNRVGLVGQNIVATATFHRKRKLPVALALKLSLLAVPGAVLGALVAVDIDDKLFQRILAGLLLLSLYTIVKGSSARHGESAAEPPHPRALALSFVAMGFYAGFVQAGLGFLLLASLSNLAGLDLIRSNAVKVAVVLFLQLVALAVFQSMAEVDWLVGCVLAAAMMAGAWLGTHWQLRSGVVWVRRLVILLMILFSIRLFSRSF